jgi:polysaccharide chain length determinant protein (PEP-CTERM system associated)
MDELTNRIDPLDYLRILRRRKAWLIVPFILTVAAGVALLFLLPSWYRSTTTIAATGPQVSSDLVRSDAVRDREERVRAFEQQLLSGSTLQQVVREERLAADTSETLLAELRRRITVLPAAPIGPADPMSVGAFQISYVDRSPDLAYRVTGRLAQVFVAATAKTREARAEDTSAFLESQLQASQARLRSLEASLTQQKQRSMGSLPEQTTANLQLVSGLRQQLEASATALRGEQDRLTFTERQIETMKQEAQKPPVEAAGGDKASAPADKVKALEEQLARAQATYTSKHPEVLQLQAELRAAREAAAKENVTSARLAALESSPAYRQLLADREQARLRVAGLQQSQDQLARQIAMYEARVEAAPLVEQHMASLQRDYDLENKQYLDLSAKLTAASLAGDLERKNATSSFKILYPASVPREPYFPNRPLFLLGSIAGGLLLGVGLTFLREFLDRSVHDARALHLTFAVPVLGEIPRIKRVA